jgi:hypothetical protein
MRVARRASVWVALATGMPAPLQWTALRCCAARRMRGRRAPPAAAAHTAAVAAAAAAVAAQRLPPDGGTPKGLAGSSREASPPTPAPRPRRGPVGGGGPGAGGPGGSRPPRRPEDTALGLLVFAGLVGSAATVLGALCGVDPFGHAHWDARDAALGLALAAPVMALDAAILVPTHRAGEDGVIARLESAAQAKLRKLEDDLAAKQAAAAAAGGAPALQQQGVEGGERRGSSKSTVADSAGSRRGLGNPAGSGGPPQSTSPAPPPPPPPPPPPLEPRWLSQLRNGLFLAQGQLCSANPSAAARLPVTLEAAATGAECLASEMLWRAVLLQALGGWLADRLFEAGADEMLHIGGRARWRAGLSAGFGSVGSQTLGAGWQAAASPLACACKWGLQRAGRGAT